MHTWTHTHTCTHAHTRAHTHTHTYLCYLMSTFLTITCLDWIVVILLSLMSLQDFLIRCMIKFLLNFFFDDDRWELLCWKRAWFHCCYKRCVPRQDKYSLLGKNLKFFVLKLIYINFSSKHFFVLWELIRAVYDVFMWYMGHIVTHTKFCIA